MTPKILNLFAPRRLAYPVSRPLLAHREMEENKQDQLDFRYLPAFQELGQRDPSKADTGLVAAGKIVGVKLPSSLVSGSEGSVLCQAVW